MKKTQNYFLYKKKFIMKKYLSPKAFKKVRIASQKIFKKSFIKKSFKRSYEEVLKKQII